MARIKSPLLMADGARVRTMEELREHFDIVSVLAYYDSGKLHEWLESYYYDEEADEIGVLDPSSADIKEKICSILGVSCPEEEAVNIDLADVADKNKRLEKLKKYTGDDELLRAVDYVAFTQEELQGILDGGAKRVYLCQEQGEFEIPEAGGVTYIGVNHPSASVPEWFGEKGIVLQNVEIGIEELLLSAEKKYSDKDYDEAVKLWSRAAAFGNAVAQRKLGRCYCNGDGVAQDYKEAFNWYRKAAEQGDAEAQYEIGNLYCDGKGVDQNIEEAEKWNQKAAQQGHERAMRRRPRQKEFEAYVEKCKAFFLLIDRMSKSWEAWNGELNTHEGRVQYAKFLNNLVDRLDAKSYFGNMIYNNICNLNSFAQTMFSRYKELRITEFFMNGESDPDVMSFKVDADIRIAWNENENRTLKECFQKELCEIVSNNREFFSVKWMESNPSYEDIHCKFQSFDMLALRVNQYKYLFNQFYDSLLKELDGNNEMLDEVIALSKQYPIAYEKVLETTFIWQYEAKGPYIEIEIPYKKFKEEYRNQKDKHYATIYFEPYETTIVFLHFCNMPMSSYTVKYHLEKNEYMSLEDYETHIYAEVEWGEWVSEDVCELKVTRISDTCLGDLTIKIMVDEVQDAVAFIKDTVFPPVFLHND